ncbi:MAG: alpha-2-macroglobulin family protein, partial [Candidatus Promineifilaceae bacterium]
LSLALVDLAVLSLLEDNAPPILDAFYAKQPMRSDTGSGLIISGEGLEIEIPLEIGGMGGGGGGLDDVALKAVALEEGDTVREDFPDTAFWRAKIATDANGQASIDIPLPDSLTTWRLSSKAVSEYTESQETLVGQDQADIVATLPLLIRPITPRFFTVGDRLGLGAVVHNNTDEMIEADVSLIAFGLTHEGEARQSFDIPAGGRQVVRWPVVVEDTQFADLTFRVSGGGFSDATKPTFGIAPDQLIPVVRFSGEDTVGTSGVIDDADRRVEAVLLPEKVDDSRGELLLNLNPSLAAALFETLDYVNWLEERPSCSHAVADQLLPNTAAYQALQSTGYQDEELIAKLEDLIQRDIQWLEQLQMESGGWGWCYSEEADPVLSAYALLALSESQKSGFSVYDLVIDRGMRYLRNQLQDVEDLLEQYQVNRQTYFLYVLSELGWDASLYLDDLFTQRRALLDPYARGLMLMAYENVGSSEDQQQTLISDLNNSVVLSATGAHWEDTVPDWNNLSSDIRGTAMIVTALVENDPENILLPNAVRWLMTARTADHWPTGQDTAWSVSALGDWMAESGELDINYDYKVALNGRGLGQGHFGVEDMLTSESMTAPVQDLKIDDVNFVDIQRDAGEGHLYYTLHLDSFIDADDLEDVNRGIIVQRAYYDADCDPEESECEPISDIESGQQVRVELTIIVPNDLVYAVVRDPIPAGAEAIDPGLETTGSSPGSSVTQVDNDYNRGYWGWWYFNRIEYRDEAVVFLSDFLPAGTYQFTYHLQTTIPGEYQVLPATATEEFFPEVFGRSHGQVFTITE